MKTNQERGTIRDGVSGFLCKQKATNPVPNGSPSLMVPRRFSRKLPTYDKHDKLEAGDK